MMCSKNMLPTFSLGPAMSPGSIVMSVFVCMLFITMFGWVGYAYFNPNTSSGRFLIKVSFKFSLIYINNFVKFQYRPGAWRWRQSGARYTAASIHMQLYRSQPCHNPISSYNITYYLYIALFSVVAWFTFQNFISQYEQLAHSESQQLVNLQPRVDTQK